MNKEETTIIDKFSKDTVIKYSNEIIKFIESIALSIIFLKGYEITGSIILYAIYIIIVVLLFLKFITYFRLLNNKFIKENNDKGLLFRCIIPFILSIL